MVMSSSIITSIGAGLSASIGWIGDVFDAFGTGGAFADILPVLGIVCGIGVASWGLNKIIGLVRGIG